MSPPSKDETFSAPIGSSSSSSADFRASVGHALRISIVLLKSEVLWRVCWKGASVSTKASKPNRRKPTQHLGNPRPLPCRRHQQPRAVVLHLREQRADHLAAELVAAPVCQRVGLTAIWRFWRLAFFPRNAWHWVQAMGVPLLRLPHLLWFSRGSKRKTTILEVP